MNNFKKLRVITKIDYDQDDINKIFGKINKGYFSLQDDAKLVEGKHYNIEYINMDYVYKVFNLKAYGHTSFLVRLVNFYPNACVLIGKSITKFEDSKIVNVYVLDDFEEIFVERKLNPPVTRSWITNGDILGK